MRNDYSTRKRLGQAFVFALVMLAMLPALAQEPVKPDADGVQRTRIVAGSYFFKPNHIVVKVNVPVELTASRESGITPHDLVIQADDAGLAVKEDLGSKSYPSLRTSSGSGHTPAPSARA